jgi:hypothetical protein
MLGRLRSQFQKKNVDVWTQRGHQGRLISVKKDLMAIDGQKLWLFEVFNPDMRITGGLVPSKTNFD